MGGTSSARRDRVAPSPLALPPVARNVIPGECRVGLAPGPCLALSPELIRLPVSLGAGPTPGHVGYVLPELERARVLTDFYDVPAGEAGRGKVSRAAAWRAIFQ